MKTIERAIGYWFMLVSAIGPYFVFTVLQVAYLLKWFDTSGSAGDGLAFGFVFLTMFLMALGAMGIIITLLTDRNLDPKAYKRGRVLILVNILAYLIPIAAFLAYTFGSSYYYTHIHPRLPHPVSYSSVTNTI